MSEAAWASELRAKRAISQRKSYAAEAADALREFILLGKLKAGMPVREREMAEALGVSRTPLKEALRILEHEGLVVYGPTRRPHVADPSLEELAENLAVLGALEALAGELACVNATDDEIAHAATLERKMGEAPLETDPLAFFRWDMEFHQTIVAAARNKALLEAHNAFNARLWRARFISSKKRTGRDSTLGQHEDILGALQARNGPGCAGHLRRHLETAITNIAAAQALPDNEDTT